MASDNTDAIIGASVVFGIIVIGSIAILRPPAVTQAVERVVETVEAIATAIPTVVPTLAPSELIANPVTLSSIFETIADNPVTPEMFNAMLQEAGIGDLPPPPKGWQYVKDKLGIQIKESKDLAKKIK